MRTSGQRTGCTVVGVCGKQPEVAALQDLLVYTLKGIAFWADKARANGKKDQEIDRFMIDGLFTTVTNVDFDADAVAKFVAEGVRLRGKAKQLAGAYGGAVPAAAQDWTLPASLDEQVKLGELHGVKDFNVDADIHSVREIITYGIKGYAAYADHARILGKESDEIYAFTHKALAAQLDDSLDLMANVEVWPLKTGRINYVTMELLNQAHVEAYGHPVPTPVQLGTKAGKAILVSGHDLKFLEELLKQTEGTGDQHLHPRRDAARPRLSRPEEVRPPGRQLRRRLAGPAQGVPEFPGAIIFNTNCIQKPADSYKDRLFTWGLVQWPGVKHVEGWDFSAR